MLTNLKYPASALILVFVTACGGSSSPAPAPPPPPPSPTNAAPVFTSGGTATFAERESGIVYTATATDADNDTLTYSLSGGSDASLFSIGNSNGELRFTSVPDFENPTDAGGDNVYDVEIAANDGTVTTILNLAITVSDVTNMPIIVRRIASGLSRPVYISGAGDGTDRLFIVEQRGLIKIIDPGSGDVLPDPFLDLTGTLASGNEQGLLGLAFAPDFATSGLFYVNITNSSGDTEIVEYGLDPGNDNRALPGSRRLIISIDQPATNHNAGWIGFGPDGFLYIPTGDGGGGGDPQGNGQNINTLLGAILRLDPSGDDFPTDANTNYAIPAGNPFVGTAGADEIWAYGLRNPFRASFDRMTGDFYIGDVGQGAIEEVDLIPSGTRGQNFGWNILEGTRNFAGGNTAGLTSPIAQYEHNGGDRGGFSITGGYVHRGSVSALAGEYIFADFVSDNIFSIPLSSIAQGTTIAASAFTLRTSDLGSSDVGNISDISSFGEDDDGELYIVSLTGGSVFKVESEP